MKKLLILAAILLLPQMLEAKETYKFANRDTCNLYLDIYRATPGSETTFQGKEKPLILFVFGGGFITGRRDDPYVLPWFQMYNDNGYDVVSIDYRLGMKNAGKLGLLALADRERMSVQLAVDDLYSATAWLCEHAQELGVNPYNMVITGSSAGAMTVLQADWELVNGDPAASVLPEGFRYAGIISFAGAVLSTDGAVRYKQAPAPTLLFHGEADKVVVYKQIKMFGRHFCGSSKLAEQYERGGYNYNIYRYPGHTHEIASSMKINLPEQLRFIEQNVILGNRRIVDTRVTDPNVPEPFAGSFQDLY